LRLSTLPRKFGDVFFNILSGESKTRFVCGKAFHQLLEVFAGEFPLKRSSDVLVIAFELGKMNWDVVERGEIVWGEDLSLNDGEEDLDLIEPAGMGWGMNEYGIGPLLPEALDRSLPAMNGSVIDDPENSASRCDRVFGS